MSEELAPQRAGAILSNSLQGFEAVFQGMLRRHGLPDEIFAPVQDRGVVFQNVHVPLERLSVQQKSQALYISKFMASVAAGLFDAALAYLWTETVVALRSRVAQYDLTYFYDVAISDPAKRARFSNEADLAKLEDSELIDGCYKMGLVTEDAKRHLEHIKWLRNSASNAHPPTHVVTALELVACLDTAMRLVITAPLPTNTIEIGRLLTNIKLQAFNAADAARLNPLFADLTEGQASSLSQGMVGIYTNDATTQQTRENIRLLFPLLWQAVRTAARTNIGLRCQKFMQAGETDKYAQVRELLELVGGIEYVPESLLEIDFDEATDRLWHSHNGYNNFHNEVGPAAALRKLVGTGNHVPKRMEYKYVMVLAYCFLTNGNGSAWNADPYYEEMLGLLTPTQAAKMLYALATDTQLGMKYGWPRSQARFRRLLTALAPKLVPQAAKDLWAELNQYASADERVQYIQRDDGLKKRIQGSLELLFRALEL